MLTQAGESLTLYVGTYTQGHDDKHPSGESEGLYVLSFDTTTGALEVTGSTPVYDNPCYLVFHPSGRYLYSVHEVWERREYPDGAVSAFTIEPVSGRLRLLNRLPSGGGLPCYVSLDRKSRFLLVANYGGGSITVFPVKDDGSLGAPVASVQHEGSSVNPERQQGPHPHSFFVDHHNTYALVPDLGLDKVLVYGFDETDGNLVPNVEPYVRVALGSGPRHFDFHPDGRHAYVVNELNSTVTVFSYNGSTGGLTDLQTLPTVPSDFGGVNYPADLHVHPSGKFLYASNRGHDSIAIFRIDQLTHELTHITNEHTGGGNPRNFTIDPTGEFVVVGNQDSNTVVSFRIDQKSGVLKATGRQVSVPSPACHKFAPSV